MILLSYTPTLLMLALVCVLVKRRAYRQFPCFFAYAVFAVMADLARFSVQSNPGIYFYAYWATEAGYDLLGIVLMYEVFQKVFGGLIRVWWARLVFPSIVIASVVLSMTRDHATSQQVGGPLMLGIVMGEIAVRFVEVLVFISMVSMVRLLGLRWRQYAFGIATGFGFYATVALLTTTKFSDFGTDFNFLWGASLVVSYSMAVVIWIWFFGVAEKTRSMGPAAPSPSPEELERYKEALRRLH
jgi:hypothetical protein